MIWGLETLATNNGMTFINIVLVVVVFASLIFMAKSLILGVVLLFLTSGLVFMWGYYLNSAVESTNYVPALVVCMLSFVIMCLSLYFVNKRVSYGGVI